MIVKKMPILQGFSDFETVKILSKYCISVPDFRPVFYDIETTGLSQYSTFTYLIGSVVYENENWILYQWFGENEEDEPDLLNAFFTFAKNYTCTIQYNGNRFDQPYLEARARVLDIHCPLKDIPALDLYQVLKPCKELLKLSRMKQPDLEAFLQMPPRLFCDGREGIRCYQKYVKHHDKDIFQELTGHNQEDLSGLGKIMDMTAYLFLFNGTYEPVSAEITGDLLQLTLHLPMSIPALFSNGNPYFYISGEKDQVGLLIPLKDGKLRQYYRNYKDYDYLPAEDTAIPKSLSAYMDKSLRTPAKKDTCYTWFKCDELFLSAPDRQMQYLKNTLPFLLSTL